LRYSEDAGVFADDHIALPSDGQKDTIQSAFNAKSRFEYMFDRKCLQIWKF